MTTSILDLQFDLLVEIAGHVDSLRDLAALNATCTRFRHVGRRPEVLAAAIINHHAPLSTPSRLLGGLRETQSAPLDVTRMLLACYETQSHGAGGCWERQDWDEWALAAVELGMVDLAELLFSRRVIVTVDPALGMGAAGPPRQRHGHRTRQQASGAALPRRSANCALGSTSSPSPSPSNNTAIARHSLDPATLAGKPTLARVTPSQAAVLKAQAPSLAMSSMAGSSLSRAESTFSLAMPSMRILQRNSRNLSPPGGAGASTSGPAMGTEQLGRGTSADSRTAASLAARTGVSSVSRTITYSHPEDAEGLPEKHCPLANVHFIGDAPLRHACHAGDLAMVRMLLMYGADVHARDGMPLALASGGGHLDLVKYLIDEAGANVQAGGNKALAAAIASFKPQHLQVLSLLLESGADVHSSDDFALRWACSHGRLDIAALLLKHGANVHAGMDDALYQAAKNGYKDLVALLLNHGSDPRRCQDAIRRAEERGHKQVAAMLRAATRDRMLQRIFGMLFCGRRKQGSKKQFK